MDDRGETFFIMHISGDDENGSEANRELDQTDSY